MTKTPLPDAQVLSEFAIVAAENSRRLLDDAETLLTRGGWPTAYSLALLALEEAGKSWLCLIGLVMPGELKAMFPFGTLVGSHMYKLQAARMMIPLLVFIKDGPDQAMAEFANAIDVMEDLARADNLAKQKGLYADYQDGAIWSPGQIRRDEARTMVGKVRDLIDRSSPLTDPGFLRFMAAPPEDAKIEIETLFGRLLACVRDENLDGVMAIVTELHSRMDGISEAFEQDARRMTLTRSQRTRTQPRKLPRAQRTGKAG